MDRRAIKAEGKIKFQQQYGASLGIMFAWLGIIIVIELISKEVNSSLGNILSIFVESIVTIGFVFTYLKVYKGKQIDINDLFSAFKNYAHNLGGYLWKSLWFAIWFLIFEIPGIVIYILYRKEKFGEMIKYFKYYDRTNSVNVNEFIMQNNIQYQHNRISSVGANGNISGEILIEILMFIIIVCLLSIPSIIKSYSYSMMSYILMDQPDIEVMEALRLSKKMTKGHKMEIFLFDLSFIGWIILSVFTMFLLFLFYVGPYIYTAYAGIYEELKREQLIVEKSSEEIK